MRKSTVVTALVVLTSLYSAGSEPLIASTRLVRDSESIEPRGGLSYYVWRDNKFLRLAKSSSDSAVKAPEIAKGQPVLIYVHGYGNSFSEAVSQAREIEKWDCIKSNNIRVVAFDWPSAELMVDPNTIITNAKYADHVSKARQSGEALRRLVNHDLKGHQVFLLAHSMGCRIVCQSLAGESLLASCGTAFVAAEVEAADVPAKPELPIVNLYSDAGDWILRAAHLAQLGLNWGPDPVGGPSRIGQWKFVREQVDSIQVPADQVKTQAFLHCYQRVPFVQAKVEEMFSAPVPPLLGHRVKIRNFASGALLEVNYNQDTQLLQQVDLDDESFGTPSIVTERQQQRWIVTKGQANSFAIKNQKAGKSLQVKDADPICTNVTEPKWAEWQVLSSSGHFKIKNVSAGKYLQIHPDHVTTVTGTGGLVILADESSDASQLWDFEVP